MAKTVYDHNGHAWICVPPPVTMGYTCSNLQPVPYPGPYPSRPENSMQSNPGTRAGKKVKKLLVLSFPRRGRKRRFPGYSSNVIILKVHINTQPLGKFLSLRKDLANQTLYVIGSEESYCGGTGRVYFSQTTLQLHFHGVTSWDWPLSWPWGGGWSDTQKPNILLMQCRCLC